MRKLIFISVLVSFLTMGCEGNGFAKGFVYDAEAQTPLKNVQYRDVAGWNINYTDAVGKYYIEGPTGSCMFGCLDFDTEFSKPGYKTIVLSNPGEIIFLEKK